MAHATAVDALPDDTERLPGRSPSPEQVYEDTTLARLLDLVYGPKSLPEASLPYR